MLDAWIISQLKETIGFVDAKFESEFNFHLILKKLREFYYGDFCDFYLESTKPILKADSDLSFRENIWNILRQCNNYTLLLYHPFIPSITEELWQRNNHGGSCESILDAKYPSSGDIMDLIDFDEKKTSEIVKIIRTIVNNCLSIKKSIPSKERPSVLIKSNQADELQTLSKEIIHLGKLNTLDFNSSSDLNFRYSFNIKVNESCNVLVRFKVRNELLNKWI